MRLYNGCSFSMYCRAARGADAANPVGAESAPVEVPAGSTYASPYPALDDSVGVNIKCATTSALSSSDLYQIEATVANGVTWANLSPVNGVPFLQYSRSLRVVDSDPASCRVLSCSPGDTSCEWCGVGIPECNNAPGDNGQNIIRCESQNTVLAQICGEGGDTGGGGGGGDDGGGDDGGSGWWPPWGSAASETKPNSQAALVVFGAAVAWLLCEW
jgi:hypothetical protein